MTDPFAVARAQVLSVLEVDSMPTDPFEGKDRPRRVRPRRRRRRNHADRSFEPRGAVEPTPAMPPVPPMERDAAYQQARELEGVDESLLSHEERAYLEARRLAEEKIALYRELVKAGLIVVPLMIFVPFFGAIALLWQSWRLGRRFYRVMIEPGVRDRLVADEVGKRLNESVLRERRELEGEHARSLEQLSASIAHEIRNPITAAKSLVQQMGEEPGSDDNVEYARVALQELERVERSVSHLLRFARDEEMRTQEVSMADVLDSAIETFRERAARENVTIERRFDTEGRLRGDSEKLRRVVINLIGNAMDALGEGSAGEGVVEVSLGENLAGSDVWVRIRDNGPGIEPEAGARIFDPFFTSKQSGTGLGLPITRKLVEAHGGEVELHSPIGPDGSGTEFVLTFPKDWNGNGDGTGSAS